MVELIQNNDLEVSNHTAFKSLAAPEYDNVPSVTKDSETITEESNIAPGKPIILDANYDNMEVVEEQPSEEASPTVLW